MVNDFGLVYFVAVGATAALAGIGAAIVTILIGGRLRLPSELIM